MTDKKFFYETERYLSIEFVQKEAELLVGQDIDKLFNNKKAIKRFKEEIYPTIKLAEYLQTPYIRFCGTENKSIDAKLIGINKEITQIECTTSIDGYFHKLVSEYNKEFRSCIIGPHSKAYKTDNIEEAGINDLVYSGTQHKRQFVRQKDLYNKNSFETCIVDIKRYVKKDIEKIQSKITKGNLENKYKKFILVLSCEHNIDIQQVYSYQQMLYKYWKNIPQNPFSGVFIVNYDALLFYQTSQKLGLNPSCVPIPLLFLKN